MKQSDDEINDEIRKVLRKSFEDFEGDFGKSFDEKMLRTIGQNNRKSPVVSTIALILLLTIAIIGTKMYPRSQKGAHLQSRSNTGAKSNSMAAAIKTQVAANEENASYHKVQIESSKAGKHADHFSEKQKRSAKTPANPVTERVTFQKNGNTIFPNENHPEPTVANADLHRGGPEISSSELATQAENKSEINFLYNRNQVVFPTHFARLNIVSKPAHQHETLIRKEKPREYAFVLNVTPVKTFNDAHVRAGENRIQNLSFSGNTLGFKINTGVEYKKYQLLLSFTQLQNEIRYERGLEKFETQEIVPGHYVVRRISQEVVRKDRIHLLGAGIKRQFTIFPQILGDEALNIGVEYAHQLNDVSRNQLLGNVSLAKRIYLGRRYDIHLGPYVEYNFISRQNLNNQIFLRTYQVGISTGIRMHSQH